MRRRRRLTPWVLFRLAVCQGSPLRREVTAHSKQGHKPQRLCHRPVLGRHVWERPVALLAPPTKLSFAIVLWHLTQFFVRDVQSLDSVSRGEPHSPVAPGLGDTVETEALKGGVRAELTPLHNAPIRKPESSLQPTAPE